MNNVTQITDQTFADTINNNHSVVILYTAPWCAYCKPIATFLEKVAKDYYGTVVFGKVNTDEFSYLAEHGIRSLPTIVVVKDRVVVDKLVGSCTEQTFREMLSKHI